MLPGTYPEKAGAEVYNTCVVFGPDGEILKKYRKMHLFDIDIPGGITFKESDTLTAGKSLATVGATLSLPPLLSTQSTPHSPSIS